jgi:carbamoyltransferase
MKIVGIQKHHNSSACFIDNGKLIYYNQEERLSRNKRHSGIPFLCLQEIVQICNNPDKIVITGYNYNYDENALILSLLHQIGYKFNSDDCWFSFYSHHLVHAAKAFFNSGFDEAVVIVQDGRGSYVALNNGSLGCETTSVYKMTFPVNYETVYKRLYAPCSENGNLSISNIQTSLPIPYSKIIDSTYLNTIFDIRADQDVGDLYSSVSIYVGFNGDDCGKLMGLQSYGTYSNNIPPISFPNEYTYTTNKKLFKEEDIEQFSLHNYPSIANNNSELLNLTFHVQKSLEASGLNLINKMIDLTNCKNVILTGGVALNVVANNHYRKNIPKDVKLYVEPVCGDEGNCIGAALLYYKNNTLNKTSNILKDTYLGPLPSYNFKLFENEKITEHITKKDIAQLLTEGKLIAIFQGRAEAGPRALGNRSLLFDPRVVNGKDIVNRVKKREWFRPFACTVMLEKARDWFDLHVLEESPFMMYALEALDGIREKIPSVVHVDNTCRVQTVTKSQNKHVYELLEEFNSLTNVPLLLNTSFNLAGDPLVETMEDALQTLRRSELKYIYLPELNQLITKI